MTENQNNYGKFNYLSNNILLIKNQLFVEELLECQLI